MAAAVGFAASLYTTSTGFNLAYSDSQSHLTIARRIFDSKAPGFEQLGTVWLPMPHLLLAPFVQSLWLYKTGWAACILGILALATCVGGLYRTAARIGIGRSGRLALMLVVLANPSVLYIFTTALTEPVLLMMLVGAVAGLAHWATSRRRMSAGELMVYAGIPSGAAVLSRYEGWALVFTGTLFVLVTAWRRYKTWRDAVKYAAAYAVIPLAAVLWWLAYNWGIYGDPLEFMFGQYSAFAQQHAITEQGLLPTKGNIGLSLWTYHVSLFETVGLMGMIMALGGAVATVMRRGISTTGLLVWVSGSSWAFSLLSLYLGQTAINNDLSLPSTWWNNRFALTALPLFALLAAALVDEVSRLRSRSWVLTVVIAGLAAQNLWWVQDLSTRSAVIAEGVLSAASTEDSTSAARWLRDHYDGGGILIDESARGNAILPLTGIPLKEFFNRSAGDYFDAALADPAGSARWVFVNVEGAASPGSTTPQDSGPVDLVYKAISRDPQFASRYRVAFSTSTHVIYERSDSQ
jgi:hypothetical protein